VPGRAYPAVRSQAALLALLGCASAAWYFTILGLRDMPAGPGTMGLELGGFLATWTLMMAAMMLPALAPLTTIYLRSIRTTRSALVRAGRTAGLVTGYLASWALFGTAAFVAALLASQLATTAPTVAPWVGAGIVAAAGAYQLTPLKDYCLRQCRSPISFLLHTSNYRGPFRDVRAGAYHGIYCIGCCWGLMVVLTAVGLSNLAWMVVIAVTVLLEKTWSHGRTVSKIVGTALIVFAVFVPANPALLPGLYAAPPM